MMTLEKNLGLLQMNPWRPIRHMPQQLDLGL